MNESNDTQFAQRGKTEYTRKRNRALPFFAQLGNVLFVLFCAVVLLLSIHGLPGNPGEQELTQRMWMDDGPFDSSNERGRYALLYSVVENHSVQFSEQLAKFSSPDLAYTNGKYVSLFAPGVSLLIAPGYLLGKYLGYAQVGTFAEVAFFAILNVLLLRAIAVRLGAHPLAAVLASVVFLFASPAYAYATVLFQHHISTFFILASLYLVIRYNSWLSLAAIWLLCAAAVTVDYPNFFMLFPVGVAALGKILVVRNQGRSVAVSLHVLRVLTFAAAVVPLVLFMWFNKLSYGNPLTLSGSQERVVDIKNDKPVFERDVFLKDHPELKATGLPQKSPLAFFNSRLLVHGFYIHFVSPDRGMLMYTPVILFGFVGLVLAVRKRNPHVSLLIAVLGTNILLYSMWDDPYGGWAFGSRYLIPAYAVLSICLALLLTYWKKSNVFLLVFLAIFSYSVGVNTLGALTSNLNPPQNEAIQLQKTTHQEEKYTYLRNYDELNDNNSRSLVYNLLVRDRLSAWDYYLYLTTFILLAGSFLLAVFKAVAQKEKPASGPALTMKPGWSGNVLKGDEYGV